MTLIRLTGTRDITPPDLDGVKTRFTYEIGDFQAEKFRVTAAGEVDVSLSGTLQTMWGADHEPVSYSAAAAIPVILQKVSDGEFHDKQHVDLNTSTASRTPPDVRAYKVKELYEVPERIEDDLTEQPTGISFLTEDISLVRDQINAVSIHLIGGKLLLLPQERALIDVYKGATDHDSFSARIQSLVGMIVAVNVEQIRISCPALSLEGAGQLTILEKYLETLCSRDVWYPIVGVLKRANDLRHGYPAHTDGANNVLPAHDYFGIRYPISDYFAAWETILGRYLTAMRSLLRVLAEERNRIVSGN